MHVQGVPNLNNRIVPTLLFDHRSTGNIASILRDYKEKKRNNFALSNSRVSKCRRLVDARHHSLRMVAKRDETPLRQRISHCTSSRTVRRNKRARFALVLLVSRSFTKWHGQEKPLRHSVSQVATSRWFNNISSTARLSLSRTLSFYLFLRLFHLFEIASLLLTLARSLSLSLAYMHTLLLALSPSLSLWLARHQQLRHRSVPRKYREFHQILV